MKPGICTDCEGLGIVDIDDGSPYGNFRDCWKCQGRGFISMKGIKRAHAYMSRRWTKRKRKRFIELALRENRKAARQ